MGNEGLDIMKKHQFRLETNPFAGQYQRSKSLSFLETKVVVDGKVNDWTQTIRV